MMKKILLVLWVFLFSSCSYGWITDIGIDPLDQTSGAKPLSMGGAFAGASGDINCLFYNPAGLVNTRGIIVSGNNARILSVGAAYGTGIGNFGIGTVYKNYKGIRLNDTLKADYNHEIAFAGYGIGSDELSAGIAVKTILSQNFSVSGSTKTASKNGTDYDAGILWKAGKYVSFGVMIRNIYGTAYTLGSSDEAFPRSTRIGLVVDLLGRNSVFYDRELGLKAACDFETADAGEDQKHNSFFGVEGSFNDWFFVRFGGSSTFLIERYVPSLSFGLGIRFDDAEAAFATLKDPVTETQISYLSLSYSPGEARPSALPKEAKAAPPPPPPPKDMLKLIYPSDDFTTYNAYVVISGETRPKATVLINGVRADVGSDGTFTAVQSLFSGKNLIEISATLGSEKKVALRRILKKAKVIVEEEVAIERKIDQEVVKRAAEIAKKETELKKEKEKGVDVSKQEKLLSEEKTKQGEIKTKLIEQKEMIVERKEKVENLVTLGVIEVSPEAKFSIEAPITRGEMISWLVKASGLALPVVEEQVLVDVPKNYRFAPQIKAALDAGLITPEPGGKFRPDDPVKEKEGEAFFRAFGIVK